MRINSLHSPTVRAQDLGELGPCGSLILGDAKVGSEPGHVRIGG
jgi:hypothetical protein